MNVAPGQGDHGPGRLSWGSQLLLSVTGGSKERPFLLIQKCWVNACSVHGLKHWDVLLSIYLGFDSHFTIAYILNFNVSLRTLVLCVVFSKLHCPSCHFKLFSKGFEHTQLQIQADWLSKIILNTANSPNQDSVNMFVLQVWESSWLWVTHGNFKRWNAGFILD